MSRESSGVSEWVDADDPSRRFVRSAIEHHWDPAAIDLTADQRAVSEIDRVELTRLRGLLAQFGASEQTVTEDLTPLAVVVDDPDDQRYVATQLYDEVRHAELFDRYWEEVIRPEERARGATPTDPTDDRWHATDHQELLDRTDEAMSRLLDQDSPETRARAYCHYHLTVEGILAQTAYDWTETWYSDEETAGPDLPGLATGFRRLRHDEGRHVGFGVRKVRTLIDEGAVDPAVVVETIDELLPFVTETIGRMVRDERTDADREEIRDRIADVRDRRLEQVGAGGRC